MLQRFQNKCAIITPFENSDNNEFLERTRRNQPELQVKEKFFSVIKDIPF
jgi:hypothetical protein